MRSEENNLFHNHFSVMTTFENKIAKATIDEDNKVLEVVWQNTFSPASYREANEAFLKMIEEHNLVASVSDARILPLVRSEELEWLAQEIAPKMVAAGLRLTAQVMPESYFTRASMNEFLVKTPHFESQVFQTPELARKWTLEKIAEWKNTELTV